MSIPGSAAPFLLAKPRQYLIERSVRFNSADSAYLSRTPASAGNRKTWTWAGWVKRSGLGWATGAFQNLFSSASAFFGIRFDTSDALEVFEFEFPGGYVWTATTSAVFRDPSAWYHVVFAYDTTQATDVNRIKLYINNVQQSFASASYPAQNRDGGVNNTVAHSVGCSINGGTPNEYFSGYLADIHFIDGQALDPTSFGEFDTNGIWQPKAYTGTYGTNGFHLDFADNSTAAALGTDTSGNSNNWDVNNISVVSSITPNLEARLAGSSTGSTPTALSEVRHIFDDNATTYFGFSQSPYNNGVGSTNKKWVFSDGYPLQPGDVLSATGDTPGGWFFSVRLANGQVLTVNNTAGSLVVSSDTKISEIETGAWGYSFQYSRIYTISVNSQNLSLNSQNLPIVTSTDSLVDVPTNGTETDTGLGGEVRGNHATLNPFIVGGTYKSTAFSEGNLRYNNTDNGAWRGTLATIGITSGKWYWEVQRANGDTRRLGVARSDYNPDNYVGAGVNSYSFDTSTGLKWNNGASSSYTSTALTKAGFTTAEGIAFDADNGTLTFFADGVSLGVAFSGLTTGVTWFPAFSAYYLSDQFYVNFGQGQFIYAPPSGYKSLCTANLPPPVITKPSKYMDVKLYTGNGGTQTISGLEFSPDLVWIKNRAQADNNKLLDTVRGATEELESNTTDAEVTNADGLTAFNSDGFDLGADVEYNTSTEAYVAWTWDAGSSTVPNTDGSITSQVRANPSAGFSIVSYDNPTSGEFTVGHGLGVAPEFVIFKGRSEPGFTFSSPWFVWHIGIPERYWLDLSGPDAAQLDSLVFSAAPTSTVINLGSDNTVSNYGSAQIAYCFAPVDGYSAFGSYTGNGNADGPFVFTNMRPRWILIKRTDTTGNWTIIDTAREGYNVDNDPLFPNLSNAEGTTDLADILSNGFKLRSTDASVNASAGTYIYFAVGEAAFNFARAR